MDNITSLIIENKTWLFIVLAIGGTVWGICVSGDSEEMLERWRRLGMWALRNDLRDNKIIFVCTLAALLVLGFLLPAIPFGVCLLFGVKELFQSGWNIFKLCTRFIPTQRIIDLHKNGVDYFHEGDYENAMKSFLGSCNFIATGALEDRKTSECYIGQMFFEGKGVEKDYETAAKWFRKGRTYYN